MTRVVKRGAARVPATRDRAAPAAAARPARVEALDAIRGGALLAMIAYHFAFDLRFFGAIAADFENDPIWLAARGAIVTAFLLLVGVSLVLASRAGWSWPAFARRIATIALCAALVTAASAAVDPGSLIWFGILHAIAVMSILAAPLREHPRVALAAGIGVVVAGLAIHLPAFDARALSWIGFATAKPRTGDFVPLFPWLGVVLVGIATGHALARRGFAPIAAAARAPRWLRALGRHSLVVYMVHQPLLMGALALVLR